jgi:hypothetical protein
MKNTLPKEFIRMQKLAGIITENEYKNLSEENLLKKAFNVVLTKWAKTFQEKPDFSDEGIKKALRNLAEIEYGVLQIDPKVSDKRNLDALAKAKNIDPEPLSRLQLLKYSDDFEPDTLYVDLTLWEEGDRLYPYKEKIKEFLKANPNIKIDKYSFNLDKDDLIITK